MEAQSAPTPHPTPIYRSALSSVGSGHTGLLAVPPTFQTCSCLSAFALVLAPSLNPHPLTSSCQLLLILAQISLLVRTASTLLLLNYLSSPLPFPSSCSIVLFLNHSSPPYILYYLLIYCIYCPLSHTSILTP